MRTFKRLLVPIDFSDTSAQAFSVAVDLSSALGSEIKLFHAHSLQVPYVGDGSFYVPEVNEGEVMEQKKKELDDFAKKHAPSELTVSQEVKLGDPQTEILNVADEFQADLIVMGTHGRGGLSHLLMGSVTENILRHSNVPILSVRAEKE